MEWWFSVIMYIGFICMLPEYTISSPPFFFSYRSCPFNMYWMIGYLNTDLEWFHFNPRGVTSKRKEKNSSTIISNINKQQWLSIYYNSKCWKIKTRNINLFSFRNKKKRKEILLEVIRTCVQLKIHQNLLHQILNELSSVKFTLCIAVVGNLKNCMHGIMRMMYDSVKFS